MTDINFDLIRKTYVSCDYKPYILKLKQTVLYLLDLIFQQQAFGKMV